MMNTLTLSLAIKTGLIQASDKQLIIDANWENLEQFANLIAEEAARVCRNYADESHNATYGDRQVSKNMAFGAECAAGHIERAFGIKENYVQRD